MSPLTQRRLSLFTANRRGFWSLWIFLALFLLTLFAELIANDKPIVLSYQNQLYFPVFKAYSEKEFGGDFETEAVYRDPEVQKLILSCKDIHAMPPAKMPVSESREGAYKEVRNREEAQETAFAARHSSECGWMIWPLIRYSYDTINYDLGRPAPAPPSAENWLGVDDQGRDVLARLIYGFRLSVLFALALTISSSVIGIFAGAVQGYFGGWVDLIFQRFIEIWQGLPELFLLIILASIITPSFGWLLLILLLFSWMSLTGVVRAEFLRARNFDYVKAARALGVGEWRIMIRHVLPNAMTAAMTMIPFILAGSVTALTTLDFLGFGLPPGSPSLGELLLQGKSNPQAPWLGFTGFLVIALLLVLIIFISEAVRDAFDPRKVTANLSSLASLDSRHPREGGDLMPPGNQTPQQVRGDK
ncbi:MAG: ABC transporter permease [Alphaproteobacteria bacterium]|nr:ABC transporter permease [Alphaproteobacteria bacterium]